MSIIALHRAHQTQLEQLTGCKYAVLLSLYQQVNRSLQPARGRPFKHSVFVSLVLTLMKLRHGLTLRTIEALTGVDSVTVMRCVERVLSVLVTLPLARKQRLLLVDSSSIRVSSRHRKSYSGHKHHRCAKVQTIARPDGLIVDVSPAYLGSVHDKTLWNNEAPRLKRLFDSLVLADKAYAGAWGEKTDKTTEGCLLRPLKKGETAYRTDPAKADAYNRALSKCRVRVEHVFARLKTWRVLDGLLKYRWPRLTLIVRALAVVHNANREAAITR